MVCLILRNRKTIYYGTMWIPTSSAAKALRKSTIQFAEKQKTKNIAIQAVRLVTIIWQQYYVVSTIMK